MSKIVVPGGPQEPSTVRLHQEMWWWLEHLQNQMAREFGRAFSLSEALEFGLMPAYEEWQARNPTIKWEPPKQAAKPEKKPKK